MNTEQLLRSISVFVILAIMVLNFGCSRDSGTTGPVAGALSLTFQSNKANFSANGKYDTTKTTGSGVGGFKSADLRIISVFAYRFNSSSDVDVVIMLIADSAAVRQTTYHFTESEELLFFHYYPHVNPDNSSGLGYPYLLKSGSIVVTSINQDNIVGTFSGKGAHAVNPSDSITVSNGGFSTSLEVMPSSIITHGVSAASLSLIFKR